MKMSINAKFEIGQMVYATLQNGKTYKARIHMVRAEWSPYGESFHYDVTMDYDKELNDWYIANVSEEQIKPYYDKCETARKRFGEMSLTDCINMWNNSACDHYKRYMAIHEMGEEDWWNTLSKEYGTWDVLNSVLSSGMTFNNSDHWFFFDDEDMKVISFSTKQELIEQIGDDFFIETLMNGEYEL